MKGDFTRDTFDPLKHFSRVLMQQGRVTLDADANEQSAILLHYVRTLARDLIGPYAAPFDDQGFVLTPQGSNVMINHGRCYVGGILAENDQDCLYWKSESDTDTLLPAQPNYPVPKEDDLRNELAKTQHNATYWLYLDVWEQHITPVEDDSIREKALGGPDTCTRAKVVWQVKAIDTDQIITRLNNLLGKLGANAPEQLKNDINTFNNDIKRSQIGPSDCAVPLHLFSSLSDASLTARVDSGVKTEDPCVTPPASKYRGAENQLYRVEIHRGGIAWDGSRDEKGSPAGNIDTAASFEWSRNNGSVVTAWLDSNGNDLQVASTRGFAAGNWVELSDDNSELLGQPGVLVQLVKVEGDALSVDAATTLPARSNYPANPKVRRWDQIATEPVTLATDNAIPIQESPVWIDLEDGVQIQFSADGEYRTGDYWLIPARVATGNVEWPQTDGANPQPKPLPPHDIEHHYAPLGFIWWGAGGMQIQLCGCIFHPLSSCAGFYARPLPGDIVISDEPRPAPLAPPPTPPTPRPAAPRPKASKGRTRRGKTGPSSPAEGAPS